MNTWMSADAFMSRVYVREGISVLKHELCLQLQPVSVRACEDIKAHTHAHTHARL